MKQVPYVLTLIGITLTLSFIHLGQQSGNQPNTSEINGNTAVKMASASRSSENISARLKTMAYDYQLTNSNTAP